MNDQLNTRLCHILEDARKRGWDDVRLWIGRHIRAEEQAAKPRRARTKATRLMRSSGIPVRGGGVDIELGRLNAAIREADDAEG